MNFIWAANGAMPNNVPAAQPAQWNQPVKNYNDTYYSVNPVSAARPAYYSNSGGSGVTSGWIGVAPVAQAFIPNTYPVWQGTKTCSRCGRKSRRRKSMRRK